MSRTFWIVGGFSLLFGFVVVLVAHYWSSRSRPYLLPPSPLGDLGPHDYLVEHCLGSHDLLVSVYDAASNALVIEHSTFADHGDPNSLILTINHPNAFRVVVLNERLDSFRATYFPKEQP